MAEMTKQELFKSRVVALLAKLEGKLSAHVVPSKGELDFFDKSCDALFAIAPEQELHIKCIRAVEAAEAAVKERKAWLEGRQKALEAAQQAAKARRELWLAGKAEAEKRAKSKRKNRPAPKANWRAVKGATFTSKELSDIEAAMLAPRAEEQVEA